MNKIKFNDLEVPVEGYNKNTFFNEDSMQSTATCQVVCDDIDALYDLMHDTITSIQIRHDNELIYDLQNIQAKIDNISEYLSMDRMNININFTFV